MSDENEPYVEVEDAEELRELLGPVVPRAATKDRPDLHPVQQAWVAASPFCLVGTSDTAGRCDVSPKGDPAGFTLVLDAKTVALPERPGNRRGDGFHNVLENPHVGLLYMIPGRTETLRINGRARLLRDAPFFDRMTVKGHRPTLALLVEIEQVFFHCAKAFLRSELWQPDCWKPEALPSYPKLSHAMRPGAESLEELERYYGAAYAEGLYRER